MYITVANLAVGFGKVGGNPRSNQRITFARCLDKALAIDDGELATAALDQALAFQLARSDGNGWSLDAEHYGQYILGDRQCIIVVAVTHHQQPSCQPLLEAVCPATGHRDHNLLEKSLDISLHEASERGHRGQGPDKGGA